MYLEKNTHKKTVVTSLITKNNKKQPPSVKSPFIDRLYTSSIVILYGHLKISFLLNKPNRSIHDQSRKNVPKII